MEWCFCVGIMFIINYRLGPIKTTRAKSTSLLLALASSGYGSGGRTLDTSTGALLSMVHYTFDGQEKD